MLLFLQMILVILVLTIVFFVFFITIIFLNSLFLWKTRVPFVSSGREACSKILDQIKITPEMNVVDMGCGNGQFLFMAANKYPAKYIGYELSPVPYFWGLMKSVIYNQGNVKIKRSDFLQADISQMDLVYIYLVGGPLIVKLTDKLKKELKPGAIVISKGTSLNDWEPIDEILLNEVGNYFAHVYRV